MKSYGVIVQMKATKQYNHEVQFIMMYKMVLACKYTTLKKTPNCKYSGGSALGPGHFVLLVSRLDCY